MSKYIVGLMLGTALAAVPLASYALGTNEKGCVVGGAAGGVLGHVAGDHALLGAAVGCGVGIYANKERVKRIDAEAKLKKQQQASARKRQHVAKREVRPEPPRHTEEAPR